MTLTELAASVPIRERNGRPFFVAMEDIPQPWRTQFMQAMIGSAVPPFAEMGECAFVWDWKEWLEHGRWGDGGPRGLDSAPQSGPSIDEEALMPAVAAPEIVHATTTRPEASNALQEASELSQSGGKPHLDAMKHRLGCEVLARFPLDVIRKRSLENLARWKMIGTWGLAYDEWLEILESKDDVGLVTALTGLDENSTRLRQSMPCIGMVNVYEDGEGR